MKRILQIQKEIGSLAKQSKNPFFKSAYLDLNDLLTHVTPLLNSVGLVLSQELENGDVTSKIIDGDSGVLIAQSRLALPQSLTDPQKIGSCITYYRRYTLKSLLAINEVDDDGNLAAKPTKQRLNDVGFNFLISDKSTKEDMQKALDNRIMETEQRVVLTDLLKTK